MHHFAQKISNIFSDLQNARCAPEVLFFVPPTFHMKVTPLELGLVLGLATNNAKPNFYFSHFTHLLVPSRNPWFHRFTVGLLR